MIVYLYIYIHIHLYNKYMHLNLNIYALLFEFIWRFYYRWVSNDMGHIHASGANLIL